MQKSPREIAFDKLDILPDTSQWPKYFRGLLNRDHLYRKERFELWLFLYRNGLPPQAATWHVLWQRPAIRNSSGRYDNSAVASVKDLEKKAESDYRYLNKFPVYDLSIGKVTKQLADGTWV